MARDGERGRGDWKARLGARSSGPYAAESFGDLGPVDIAAVRRDDALIDAIAGDGQVHTDSAEEYRLATLLADWRAELVSAPMPADPDLDAIVAAVNQEIGARRVRTGTRSGAQLRLLRPIAATAAALALVVGSMTAFSYGAEPGDPLWPVKEVVFSEQAQTTVVQRADNALNEASALVEQNPMQAKSRLERAKENTAQVSDSQKRGELTAEWQRVLEELRKVSPELAGQLEPTTSEATDPRPTPDRSVTTTSTPTTDETGPTILQQPVEGSGTPSQSTDTTAPNSGTPTTSPAPTTAPTTTQTPASTQSPVSTVPPTSAEPPTNTPPPGNPTTQPPRPSTAEPSMDAELSTVPPRGGSQP
ncbi:anti-sigma-D factor RsdA [Nocardia sp. 004]|uniref:anti-sigma-D factor RsdA n=1 Tax=Nocardia sp. 004 TaxID=3385978 RepID=UPI0039A2C416